MNKFKSLMNFLSGRELRDYEMETLLSSSQSGDIKKIDAILKDDRIKIFKHLIPEMFNLACKNNQLKLIEYFLTDRNAQVFHDVHLKSSKGIVLASQRGYLDIVKFLVSSNKIKKHSDIHADNDILFITAYSAKRENIIEYLILDHNLEKTKAIEAKIAEIKSKQSNSDIQTKQREFIDKIDEMFMKTSVNIYLNKELVVNPEKKPKKLKI
jgi:hypothetical protein